MKETYNFSNRADRYRRFSSCSHHVGDTQNGKAVYAWNDGLWVVDEHVGATVSFTARRVSVDAVAIPRDTLAARLTLAQLIESYT